MRGRFVFYLGLVLGQDQSFTLSFPVTSENILIGFVISQ